MATRKHRLGVTVAAAAISAATLTTVGATPAAAGAADPCVSGADVREQVHELVASLRDDVKAKSTRADIAAALVDTLRTYRDADADTAAERRALGQEIAALGKQLDDADSLVARKAIIAQILALTEQRERGHFTDAERSDLKAAVAKLKRAVVAKTDSRAEGHDVAAAFSALHEQFTCTPA